MGTLLIVLIIVSIIAIILASFHAKKKRRESIETLGINSDELIIMGKYVSGHPDIDTQFLNTEIYPSDNSYDIYANGKEGLFIIGSIPCYSVASIVTEDASTLEKRVTVARMLALGVFALAVKKSDKTERSFLVIEWKDERFDHETIFEFTGSTAVEQSNIARNRLIRAIKSS